MRFVAAILASQYRWRAFPSSHKILFQHGTEDSHADEDFQWVVGNKSVDLRRMIEAREMTSEQNIVIVEVVEVDEISQRRGRARREANVSGSSREHNIKVLQEEKLSKETKTCSLQLPPIASCVSFTKCSALPTVGHKHTF